jgi:hypothetical protein
MKTTIISIFLGVIILLSSESAFSSNEKPLDAPKKATLSGKVIDKKTGESLVGALISIKGTDIKIYSDLEGNFNISNIEPGSYSLEINYISYAKTEIQNIGLSEGETSTLKIDILPN